MVTIIFESHGTTFDNEQRLSSGWYDAELSPLGMEQAKQLGERRKHENFAAIFCSDLKRSYHTAEIAFAGRDIEIIKDARLREANYGDLNRQPESEVTHRRGQYITKSYPNGESYEQTTEKTKTFLEELLQNYDGKKVLIIDHRATQYALEHFVNHVPLEKAVTDLWAWQPGWEYNLKEL